LNTSAHRCSAAASNKLAFPAQILQRTYIQFTPTSQVELSTHPPLSIPELSEWRLTSISEWRSTCHTTSATTDGKSPCHCPASHICGSYLVVDLTRTHCGCRQLLQIRANAYNEQFLFLDHVLGDSLSSSIAEELLESRGYAEDTISSDDNCDRTTPYRDGISDDIDADGRCRPQESTCSQPAGMVLSASQYSNLNLPSSLVRPSKSKDLLKEFLFLPAFSKRFSLADLAFLLYAIRQVHADNRWTEAYADRSLIDFTISEAARFIQYYANDDWKSQVWQSYRKNLSKLFYDRRVDAWSWVSKFLIG